MAREDPDSHPERTLASAALALTWKTVPVDTRASIRRLFLDWVGSALAGASSDPARILERTMSRWAGADNGGRDRAYESGTATMITDFAAASPLNAALVNAAASHVVEMDDLHNSSIYHPATCVFPALMAAAEASAASPSRFMAAAVAGYEVSIRIGEALGPEHYYYFHTTGTAGTLGAAVAVGHLLRLSERQMLWAIGNAATQAAGLWQFLAEGAMSKQLHTAKAAYNGALAAYLAELGFTGPEHGLCGERGLLPATTPAGTLAAGANYDDTLIREQRRRLLADIAATPAARGSEPSARDSYEFTDFRTPGVSIKYHASCRHTHPSVDALVALMREECLRADDLSSITAYVYTGAYERLKDVDANTPWAAKFNVPFCLAQAALSGHLTLDTFTEGALTDPRVTQLMERVTLQIDPSLDSLFPRYWPARVEVTTKDGTTYERRIDTPKGDPENPVTDAELDEKFLSLASQSLEVREARLLLSRLRAVESLSDMTRVLAGLGGPPRSAAADTA